MKILAVTLALGAALALSSAAAQAHRHHRARPVPVPVAAADPFWAPDYYVVPRYRYRPEDDRVDTSPYARPVASSYPELGWIGIGQ